MLQLRMLTMMVLMMMMMMILMLFLCKCSCGDGNDDNDDGDVDKNDGKRNWYSNLCVTELSFPGKVLRQHSLFPLLHLGKVLLPQ